MIGDETMSADYGAQLAREEGERREPRTTEQLLQRFLAQEQQARPAPMNCPKCGKAAKQTDGSIFYERGEWDGKSYEGEGDLDVWQCECGIEFCIIN